MELWSFSLWCVGLMWGGALGEDVECKKEPSAEMRLRHDLFCDYDASTRPVFYAANQTQLTLDFMPVFIDTEDEGDTWAIHTHMRSVWTDAYLTWAPSKYDNIDRLLVDCFDLWNPNIMLYTSDHMSNSFLGTPNCNCYLTPGKVTMISLVVMVGKGTGDLALWPYDRHNCSLRIGSSTYNQDEMNTTHEYEPFLQAYTENKNWELVSIDLMGQQQTWEETTYGWIQLDFILKRHEGSDKAVVVIPAIVLSVLTLAVLWLEIGSPERFCVSCLDVICHFLYLQYLGKKLPTNGYSVPLVVLFFRDSLVLVVVSLLVTVVLHRLAVTSSCPPRWTSNVVKTVLSNRFGQLVLLAHLNPEEAMCVQEDLNTGLLTSQEPKISKEWALIATFLDRVFFLLYSLVLTALVIKFVL